MIILKFLELKIPPVALAVIMALAMWGTAALVPRFSYSTSVRRPISVVLLFLGGAVALAGVISFRRASTTVNPTMPEATTTLVRSGVYRISRNPMYLGFLLVLGGWCFFLSNFLVYVYPLLFVLYMNRFQIAPEERHLSSIFGSEFSEFEAAVHRWL